MVVEEEQPNILLPSPSSSPELQEGKLYNGSQSPEIKVVPLSELSSLFTNERSRNDSKSEDERKDDSDYGMSPSPQPLKNSLEITTDNNVERQSESAGRDSLSTPVSPVDQEIKSASTNSDSGGKLGFRYKLILILLAKLNNDPGIFLLIVIVN